MFTRRKLPVSILLTLVLALLATASVSAQATENIGGSVVFRDANAANDSIVISFSAQEDQTKDHPGVGVPRLSEGSAYEGWLISSSGDKISVGILLRSGTADIEHTYVSPTGEDLLASYSRFAVSIEPVPDPDPETPGPIAYSDAIPLKAFVHVGHLVVSLGSNPDGKGIATGLREQMDVARIHAKLAIDSSTFAKKQQHSQHVVNIIEGSGGANYDSSVGDPGDGNGVLNYAADTVKHANLAKNAAPGDDTVEDGADDAIDAANDVIDKAGRARDAALVVVNRASDDFRVGVELGNALSLTTLGLTDSETAYIASQDIALLEGLAGEAPPDVGDALVPTVALAMLVAGILLTGGGGLLVFRRRRATA